MYSPPYQGGARGGRTSCQHESDAIPAFGAAAYEAVLALDVIEHLDDDRAAVAGLARLVAPGGCLVVSVPALPELYTEFDAVQDHRRRYVPETLRAAFDGSGLEVERLFWWGSWLVPLLKRQRAQAATAPTAARRYNEYLRLPPWPATVALRALFAWEHGRSLAGRSTIGTSLFAVGRRRG
ncbi:MAG TPA: methyltransferase domain-containing protein [Nitrolancea sp.]|nr:methyltransferase domain-containing protein [Nitrolancea sp.]